MRELNFKEIFTTPYFNIESSDINYSENSPYYRIITQPSVICCLLNEQDELLLVRQYRPNLEYLTLEFPAGGLNKDESPEEGLIREIKEEVGVSCRPIQLGAYRLMMNRTTNVEYLFVALAVGKENNSPEEEISIVKYKRKEFSKIVLSGELEQMAALAIIQLINLKFGINFLTDDNVIGMIWSK